MIMALNLIPLTSDEIANIQTTVVDRMIELNRELQRGSNRQETVREINELGRISNKISKYCSQD